MRTNVVLDSALVSEAMRLSGANSKKEVIHLALQALVEAKKKKQQSHQSFMSKYASQPEMIDQFVPLSRDEANER